MYGDQSLIGDLANDRCRDTRRHGGKPNRRILAGLTVFLEFFCT